MVTVAVVAIVWGVGLLKRRQDERLRKLAYYSFLERGFMAKAQSIAPEKLSREDREKLNIFRAMRRKWERAASHLWEPVEPDSP